MQTEYDLGVKSIGTGTPRTTKNSGILFYPSRTGFRLSIFLTFNVKIELGRRLYLSIMVLEYYRLIKMTRGDDMGVIEWSLEDTVHDAYRKCIPDNEAQCCRRMLYSVKSEFASGKEVVRVTSTQKHTYWIQVISTHSAPLPVLEVNDCGCSSLKIE